MTLYEQFISEHDGDVEIYEKPMHIKGLYADGIAFINKNQTTVEKLCILAEEIGHHYTTEGNILNQDSLANRKQERQARVWAFRSLLPLERIAKYYFESSDMIELADNLDVTVDFLQETLQYYDEHYGYCADIGGYRIYFSPLHIIKK